MLTFISKLLLKGGLTVIRYCNCKKAFTSIEEANEWQFLISSLQNSESLPIELKVNFSENLDRLKRHGYSLVPSCAQNVYKIERKGT